MEKYRMGLSELYGKALRRFIKVTFPLWERLGFHVTPVHYYQPIPDTRTLGDGLWEARSALAGLDTNEDGQLALLADFADRYKAEYEAFPRGKTPAPHEYYVDNRSFESVDGEVLYCMVRRLKPARIFEIGSGFSTMLSAKAALVNASEGRSCELTAFEPYPNDTLKAGFPGLTRLVPKKIQDVPLSEFERLGEGDILFIDSSHVLTVGSDVKYEFLEVLPRLKAGVVVHIHDVTMPMEYPRDWVMKEHRFWNEQYLLQAFLAFNDSFEVLWMGAWMHLNHPDRLAAAFSSYARETRLPGSVWVRKIR
ncbi:MAG: class I SAM-dependent methyltransferase [Nitrospirae bacterium]|nr:class I SAM-dependent methyltransferase [Nitrospirota bacterium]